MDSDLKRKTTSGLMTLGSVTVILRVFNTIAWIFLARLLDPKDFGLVALAMVVFSTTNIFVGLGMEPALVHSKLETKRTAFPAFLATTLAGLLSFLIVILTPGLWAGLLGTQEVVPLVKLLSLLIFFDSLSIVPRALLKKQLLFERVGTVKFIAEVVNIVVSLVFAFLGFGYWSLAFGKLFNSVTSFILFWSLTPGKAWIRPIRFKLGELRELFSFGWKNMGSGILSFFNSNWDDWLVGRVLGSIALGFYSKAYNFTNQTIVGFSREVIAGVLFPSFAAIQDEKTRLSNMYIKSLGVVSLMMTPLSLGMIVVAREMISVLLGEKWLPMAAVLQIFAVMALVRPLSGMTSPLFKAVGRPDYNVWAGLVLTVTMAPLIFILLGSGIVGVAIAVTVAHVVGFVFNLFQLERLLPGTASRSLAAILPSLVAGTLMILGVQYSKSPLLQFTSGSVDVFALAAMVLLGAGIYGVTIFAMRKHLILETLELVLSVLRPRFELLAGKQLKS